MPSSRPPISRFAPPHAPDDRIIAARLIEEARLRPDQDIRIDRTATRLIETIRADGDRFGGVEAMLREFALSTREGLALMVLAEALLRVPDAATTDQFIEDRLGQGDFVHHETKSSAFLVNASAWALGLSARVIQPGETPQGTIGRLAKRLGLPAVRAATRQAMRLMGNHFVLGETVAWNLTQAETRAGILERAASLLEQKHARFTALLQREYGKTLDDCLSEVREAIDFCRYHAAEGRQLFGDGETMPGPTGESNMLRLRGRGVFVAISPWNFPLAIFLGQITAALMAGNAVVAKPAEQTPLIAAEAVRLLHEAGVPASALHLMPGDGRADDGASARSSQRPCPRGPIRGAAYLRTVERRAVSGRSVRADPACGALSGRRPRWRDPIDYTQRFRADAWHSLPHRE